MCFTMAWLAQFLVWCVIAIATYVILIQILLPYILKKLGAGGEVSEGVGVLFAVLRVFFWALIVIIVIWLVFDLLQCLWSMAGGFPMLLPHGR
jgi:hydrogenase-4 membrane subunit HyfE